MYDFDEVLDRRGTGSNKWDRYRDRDIVPMWVADMDFRSPPAVLRALHERVDHGVFGYSSAPDDVIDAVVAMCRQRFDWRIERDWLLWFPGLGSALTSTCRAFGDDDDEVLVMPPIYPPILLAAGRSRRRNVLAYLQLEGDRWRMDLDAIRAAITTSTRVLFLCNPHNPVGRVFDIDELQALAQICLQHDLVVCSDEVHCDLIYEPATPHLPIAKVVPELAERSLTLMAPSKTYNLPGLHCAFAIAPGREVRERMRPVMSGLVPYVSPLGYAAARAAYRDCGEWRDALVQYLRVNRDLTLAAIDAMPGLRTTPIQATYLAWIDARELGLRDPCAFFEAGGVGLSDGAEFGMPGYLRLNFGCPRAQLELALQRMSDQLRGS